MPDIPTAVRRTRGFSTSDADYRSCNDPYLRILGPIDDEFKDLPYRNEQFENDPNSQLEDRSMISIIYIENFFIDGRDFAYYIIGRVNVTAFLGGMFGMQVYDGPLTATPMMSYNRDILSGENVDDPYGGKVLRSHSPTERIKWKYLFETARLAWSKLQIDPRKVARIRAMHASMLRQRREAVRRDLGAD